MIRYKIMTTVKIVEQRSVTRRTWKDAAGNAQASVDKIGWWAAFEGSWESIYLGSEEPDIKKGDRVVITIERDAARRHPIFSP